MIFTVLAVASLAYQRPSVPASSPWESGLAQFVAEAPTAAPAHTHHVRFAGHVVYYTPTSPAPRPVSEPATLFMEGRRADVPVYIRKGRSFTGLRSLLAELSSRYGIKFDLEFSAPGRVSLTRIDHSSQEEAFGAAWAALWAGRVGAARNLFSAAASRGARAADARDLAAWLGPDSDGTPVGIIRCEWWHLPEDVNVFVDEQQVINGAPLVRSVVGVHHLRLVSAAGNELVNQAFRVSADHAFIIQFGKPAADE